MSQRDFRQILVGALAAVVLVWLVEPGSDTALIVTYTAASLLYTFRLGVRGNAAGTEVGHGLSALAPLFLWRFAGLPLLVALGLGLASQLALLLFAQRRARATSSGA